MTVWLSMHPLDSSRPYWVRYASISSHSLGVRLRTRYVRLPIPSMEQHLGSGARLWLGEALWHLLQAPGVRAARATEGASALGTCASGQVFRLPFGPQGTPQWEAPRAGVAAPSMLPGASRVRVATVPRSQPLGPRPAFCGHGVLLRAASVSLHHDAGLYARNLQHLGGRERRLSAAGSSCGHSADNHCSCVYPP